MPQCTPGRVAGIGSPRAPVEANYLLQLLVGADNYAPGFSDSEQVLVNLALALQQRSAAAIPDIRTIESADAVLVLGEDVTNTAPRIALALRQSVRNRAYELAAGLRLEHWQDAAIRNLAQDQRSPLFIAATADTPLDDVAAARLSLAPDDIAALGRAVPAGIAGDKSAGNILPQALRNMIPSFVNQFASAGSRRQLPPETCPHRTRRFRRAWFTRGTPAGGSR